MEKKPRGVRLGDLDRSKHYVLGYVGKRWEVICTADEFLGSIVAKSAMSNPEDPWNSI